MSEVLQEFQGHLSEWKKLQSFIDKTKEKTGKFSEAVIAKLVIEFEMKQDLVKDEIEPLAETMQETLDTLRDKFGRDVATWGRGMKGRGRGD